MNKFLITAVMSLALIAAPAFAETTLGVVNLDKIRGESKVMKSVRSQLQTKQKAFQGEFETKGKALQAEQQALMKQKDAGDKAAFEKKVKEFQQKANSEEQEVRTRRAGLDKAYAGAISDIQKTMQEIVTQIATEKKLTLVIPSSTVLYGDPSLDVTDEVLKRLDAKLPSYTVKF